MPKFVHIDISADDPERAAQFYEKVFGWKVQKLEGPMPYWLIATSDDPAAIGGGIAKREEAWQGATPVIDVSSVDQFRGRIEDEGGTVIVPKTLIEGVGHLLSFKDTEGNVFSILEPAGDSEFAAAPSG